MRQMVFFIKEALIGMKRSMLMMVITVGTMTVSLLVFGIFLLLLVNISNVSKIIASKVEVRLFINETISLEEINQLKTKIYQNSQVKDIVFEDKQIAWRDFVKRYKNLNLEEMIDSSPLNHTLRVILKDNHRIDQVADQLKQVSVFVENISYGSEMAAKVDLLSRGLKIIGGFLVGVLTLATLFIVVNTIRLLVLIRKDEITIMKLVGATNRFIQAPFIVEGFLLGLGGALISVVILKSGYELIAIKIQEKLPFLPIQFENHILNNVYGLIMIYGVLLGLLGAYVSISKTLKQTDI